MVPPPVAVGIQNEWRPPLGRYRIARFQVLASIQPADHPAAAAGPQGVVFILGEHQVMGAETGVDWGIYIRVRIIDTEMSAGAPQWKRLGRGVIGAFLTERRYILRVTHPGSDPHPAILIQHGIMYRSRGIPDGLVSPIG